MLFAYTYVPHAMEKMQEFIDFIFFEVWCKAPSVEYGIHLFEPSDSPLYKIMSELSRRDLADMLKDGAGKWFYESVNKIFIEFSQLSDDVIDAYRQQFKTNNLIEELCEHQGNFCPAHYSNLNAAKADLNEKLSDFFKKLYSSGFFGLTFVVDAIGSNLGDYYLDFVRKNNAGCCPFCGLLPIDNEFDPTREAFDHYLPKSKYPFNSVNLKNLAPSCNKCNSGNKQDKDPLHSSTGERRKAFYPFSTGLIENLVAVDIHSEDWTTPKSEDLTITLSSATHPEEVETWEELFRIKQRYSAKCCDAGGGLYWKKRVLEESENYDLSPQAMLTAEVKSARTSLWAESNFLKVAFLEGCQRAGLFERVRDE